MFDNKSILITKGIESFEKNFTQFLLKKYNFTVFIEKKI